MDVADSFNAAFSVAILSFLNRIFKKSEFSNYNEIFS